MLENEIKKFNKIINFAPFAFEKSWSKTKNTKVQKERIHSRKFLAV